MEGLATSFGESTRLSVTIYDTGSRPTQKEILQLEKDVKKLNDNVRVHEGLNQLERLETTIHWQSPLENCPEVGSFQ